MSQLRFLTVNLLRGSLLLLLLAAAYESQDYSDVTLSPDYEYDNSTFAISFFSNSSSEDLDRFISEVGGEEVDEEKEGMEEEEEKVSVTTATTTREQLIKEAKEGSRRVPFSSAPLPVSTETGKLLWTSVILMVLNSQQL